MNPQINVTAALRGAARILRSGEATSLYPALCLSGASAGTRFHALAALRTVALGSPEAGDLTGYTKGFTPAQFADLCEKAVP